MRTDAFYLLLRCYGAVFEAGLGRCWVVPQLEGEVYQSETLVHLLVIERDGIVGK